MNRSLDFTACDLPCEHPCWRRLTEEEREWLETHPNRQAFILTCIEKEDSAKNVSKSYRKKFNTVVKFIMENNLHKTMYKSRQQDCIDKLKEQTDEI